MRTQQLCAIGIHEDIVEYRPSIFVRAHSMVIVAMLPAQPVTAKVDRDAAFERANCVREVPGLTELDQEVEMIRHHHCGAKFPEPRRFHFARDGEYPGNWLR